MKRMMGMAALIATGSVISAAISGETKASVDPAILVYISVVYTAGIAVMLFYTRQWSWIGCGLLATMTADAILYSRLSHILPIPHDPWVLDVARACFVVGGTYLLIGLLLWVQAQRAGEDDTVMLTEGAP